MGKKLTGDRSQHAGMKRGSIPETERTAGNILKYPEIFSFFNFFNISGKTLRSFSGTLLENPDRSSSEAPLEAAKNASGEICLVGLVGMKIASDLTGLAQNGPNLAPEINQSDVRLHCHGFKLLDSQTCRGLNCPGSQMIPIDAH